MCFLLLWAVSVVAVYGAAGDSGVLPGKFSVSEGKQVFFSQGNLQYQPYQETFRFAEHQWDFVGGSGPAAGNVVYAFDKCNNCLIDDRYDGWIDLFGWGTGKDITLHAEESRLYGSFTEWGSNVIVNAGILSDPWRTLSWEEWFYLLVDRPNADALRGQATVNGVHGYILLPDEWVAPKKMDFTPNANNWATNEYKAAQWKKMEAAGAVFLPAGGFRSGNQMSVVGIMGFYWSSSIYETELGATDDARDIFFSEKRIGPRDHEKRFYGLSVRLVQDVR